MNIYKFCTANSQKIYFLSAILIFAYVAWRAFNISFSYDECYSYAIAMGEKGTVTANNHWLNTGLIWLMDKTIGNSEFSLRLPNLVSFALYLYFIFKIATHFCTSKLTLLLSIPLFLLNPFVLDFFGLARGYGMSFAFLTAAVYHLLMYFNKNASVKHFIYFLIFCILAVYANYAFLVVILSLQLTTVLYYYKKHFNKLKLCIIAYGVELILLLPAILNVIQLSQQNQLYVGGTTGVYTDSLKTVLEFSFNNDRIHFYPIISILIAIAILIGFFLFHSRRLNFLKLWIILTFFIPKILNFTMDIRFPRDRGALYWIFILSVFILITTDKLLTVSPALQKVKRLPLMIIICIQLIVVVNFAIHFNLKYTILWKYDSDISTAMENLSKSADHSKMNTIGIHHLLEPSVNYYLKTKSMEWFQSVNEYGLKGKYDYYLFFSDNYPELNSDPGLQLNYYCNSKLHAYKADHRITH